MGGEAHGALGEGAGEHGFVVRVEVLALRLWSELWYYFVSDCFGRNIQCCWAFDLDPKAMTSDEFAATAIFGISHVNM